MDHKATSLGIMSGSSLDGLDLCLSQFSEVDGQWTFKIHDAITTEIPLLLRKQLEQSPNMSKEDLLKLDMNFGEFIGHASKEMASKADIVGLHGHTVFHSPNNKISIQVGSGVTVARIAKKPTVGNFRMGDILHGGQGAPLVPMGEKCLFPENDSFLNLGGICNATFRRPGDSWIAGDIGPFNQVFNFYANKLERNFDRGGELARSGETISALTDQWDDLPFFGHPFPKSLGNDWVRDNFFNHEENPIHVLASFAEFISTKIAAQINVLSPKQTLVTGGGAMNTFLMGKIHEKTNSEIIIPKPEIIEYKEALIFGFLGLLRSLNLPNVLSSCTGASKDSCSGDIYMP